MSGCCQYYISYLFLHISYANCHWCNIIYGYVLNMQASTKNLRLATWKRAVRIIAIYDCMRIRRCPDVKSNLMFSGSDLLFIMFTITFDMWQRDICSHLPQAMLGLYTLGQSMSKIPHSIRYLDVFAMNSIPIPSSHHFIKCQVYNANLSHRLFKCVVFIHKSCFEVQSMPAL